ncbi:MAG TPA: TlpA disulfide reductase family protein, partial [Chitinophagaceae bacterium]|nr:TlpA disulfide reductase family protein [Chitinophagaceae bacterium]
VLLDGAFEFKGDVPCPTEASVHLRRKGQTFFTPGVNEFKTFYLENGTVTITGDSMQTAIVKGGMENRNYRDLQDMLQPVHDEFWQFSRAQSALPPAQRASKDTLAARSLRHRAAERDAYARFVRTHTNSFVSLNLLKYNYGHTPPVDEVGPLFHVLSPAIRASDSGKAYGDLIALWERTSPGSQAPDFTMKDTLGTAVSLHGFRGKYVLLNFWATWCGPCMIEKGDLKKTWAAFKDKGFSIVDVSMADTSGRFGDHAKWLKMVHNMKLPWTNVYGMEAFLAYGIKSTPQNYLIDPAGKVIGHDVHGPALDKKLEELLNK